MIVPVGGFKLLATERDATGSLLSLSPSGRAWVGVLAQGALVEPREGGVERTFTGKFLRSLSRGQLELHTAAPVDVTVRSRPAVPAVRA